MLLERQQPLWLQTYTVTDEPSVIQNSRLLCVKARSRSLASVRPLQKVRGKISENAVKTSNANGHSLTWPADRIVSAAQENHNATVARMLNSVPALLYFSLRHERSVSLCIPLNKNFRLHPESSLALATTRSNMPFICANILFLRPLRQSLERVAERTEKTTKEHGPNIAPYAAV